MNLTEEQKALVPQYINEARKVVCNTERIDPERARLAIEELYKANDFDPPPIIHICEGIQAAERLQQSYENPGQKPQSQPKYYLGSLDHWWTCMYLLLRDTGHKFDAKLQRRFEAYNTFTETCYISLLYREMAFISERPLEYHLDEFDRLHNDKGPAWKFRDGLEYYVWKGVRVPDEWITNKNQITVKQIKDQKNAELRRTMVEIYTATNGPQSLIIDSKAKEKGSDTNHGTKRTLYEIFGQQFVHVINGSLEPDGTRREFLLGAAPGVSTPHEAVAASYGIPADQYKEAVRT